MRVDDLVADRFHIERAVAAGGIGRVFRAVDRATGRPVAVKVLRHPHAVDLERFAREAAVLAQLSHPGIVGYVAHGETGEGEPYLVMDWIDGETLAERLLSTGLDVADSVAVTARVADALGELHRRALVHRDVKPDNILFPDGQRDRAVLIDFGIVRGAGYLHGLTRTGYTVGTLGYMAPEQARGQRDQDARVDVFALGCVLYECLTGQAPFRSASLIAVQTRILFEDPPPVGELCEGAPPGLRDLVGRMLAKDPAGRPADGAAVAASLAALGPLPAGPRRPAEAAWRGASGSDSASAETTRRLQPATRLSLVLAVLADALGDAPTLAIAEVEAHAAALRAAAAPHGARVEILADGTAVASLTSAAAPADHAARAARLALAIRRALPEVPLVLVSGAAAGEALADVIARGARATAAAAALARRSPRAAGVLVDTATAELLDARFEVTRDRAGHRLHGEKA